MDNYSTMLAFYQVVGAKARIPKEVQNHYVFNGPYAFWIDKHIRGGGLGQKTNNPYPKL